MKHLMLPLVLIAAMLVKLAQQACTSTQFLNSTSGACVDCVAPCKTCTSTTTCTACSHSEMVLSSGSCSFCPNGNYYDSVSSSCKACDSSCNGMCYGSATKCTKCSSTTFLDVENLACVASCSGISVTISGLKYCKSTNLYVDSTSTSPIELGSKAYSIKKINTI